MVEALRVNNKGVPDSGVVTSGSNSENNSQPITPVFPDLPANILDSLSSPKNLTSSWDLVNQCVTKFSDIVLNYPIISNNYSKVGSSNGLTKNLFGDVVIVKDLLTFSKPGLTLLASLNEGLKVNNVMTLSTFQNHYSALYELKTKEFNNSTVFHVSTEEYNGASGQFSSNYNGILNALNLGSQINYLVSSNVQESYDMAIIAHLVSLATNRHTVHVFDGINAGHVQASSVQTLEDLTLHLLVKEVQSLSSDFIDDDVLAYNIIEKVYNIFSKISGRNYSGLECYGNVNPATILVQTGSALPLLRHSLSKSENSAVGVLNLRTLRPFSSSAFLSSIPGPATSLITLDPVESLSSNKIGTLYFDALKAIASSGRKIGLKAFTYQPHNQFNVSLVENLVQYSNSNNELYNISFADVNNVSFKTEIPTSKQLNLQFIDQENGISSGLGSKLGTIIGTDTSYKYQVSSLVDSGHFKSVHSTTLRFSKSNDGPILQNAPIDALSIGDSQLLKKVNIFPSNLPLPKLILVNHDIVKGELANILPNRLVKGIKNGESKVYQVNSLAIAKRLKIPGSVGTVQLIGFAFISGNQQLSKKIRDVLTTRSLNDDFAEDLFFLSEKSIKEVDISSILDLEETVNTLPEFYGLAPNLIQEVQHNTLISNYDQLAMNLIFKPSFSTENTLRPDAHDTFLITLAKSQRLTPLDYDRNVFHMEFDIANSGLSYEIGDALGVYGVNNHEDVEEFLVLYGENKDAILEVFGLDGKIQLRTAAQAFGQLVDIFGKPTKKFYTELASYAKDEDQKQKLIQIASPSGAEEFKARGDDTVTYADLLLEFDSARPSLKELAAIVPYTKPRHYSISSSMHMHPNSVHLLVVLVEWKNSKNKQRFGQATRYLSTLQLGSQVTVSVKPSVMKLPPRHDQPVIMAGLGTGMAPFKAFIEERAYLQAQGHKVGPMALYFGSRHRASEYLYGAELDHYHSTGLLTHLGLAFSRDQKEKIYIQHVITKDSHFLGDWLLNQEGYFYLCGPIWPEPDVKEAMAKAIEYEVKQGIEKANETIEKMKEDGQYILELY